MESELLNWDNLEVHNKLKAMLSSVQNCFQYTSGGVCMYIRVMQM